MIIRNKFNGYSRDGTRVYPDPMTIAGVLGTGEGMLGTGIATGALESGIAAGTTLASGIATTGLLGELGLSAIGTPAMGGLASIPAATASTIAPAAAAQAAGTVAPQLAQSLGTTVANPSSWAAANQAAGLGTSQLASAANPGTWGAVNQAAGLGTQGLMSNAPQMMQTAENLGQATDLASKAAEASPLTSEAAKWSEYATKQGWSNPANPAAQIARETLPSGLTKGANALENFGSLIKNPSWQGAKDFASEHPYVTSGLAGLAAMQLFKKPEMQQQKDTSYIRPYKLDVQNTSGQPYDPNSTAERQQLTYNFTPQAPYDASTEPVKKAVGGPVETMSAMNAVGANDMYPQSQLSTSMYSNPMVQRPTPTNMITQGVDTPVDPYTGEQKFAHGGIADLGGYSDGGRLLKGPGDGVSDSIPASIGGRQPARLADGEFVVPARIVSELGNGSTEAGARKLYAMMDRVQKSRGKTVGKDKVAVNSKADKHLPA